MSPPPAGVRRVVFFDGVCALCDASVRTLIGIDRKGTLRFAPLQGSTAAREPALARLLERGAAELRSLIYLRDDGQETHVLTRSDAILAVLDDLGGVWRALGWLRICPRGLRDRVYDLIARNRYRWFGRLEACRLPREGEAARFLP